MSCAELLVELRNLGARVWLEDDRLRISAPRGVLNDDLRSELKSRRSELIGWLKRQQGDAKNPRPVVAPRARPEFLPLSYAQQRLWFLYRMEGPSATYNIPLALRLEGELNVNALEQALADVVARHETLRTIFPEHAGAPYQKILSADEARPVLHREEIEEAQLSARLATAAATRMDLGREIPLRAWIFRAGPRNHVLFLLLHHIAGDAWSMGPLARDLEESYRARVRGILPSFGDLPVQYADYTLWQRELLGEDDDAASLMSRQTEFWRTALAEIPEQLALPTDRPRPATASSRGDVVPLVFDAQLHTALLRVAQQSGASLFMVLQAGVAALLARLGAGDDIPIGTVIAGRDEKTLEGLVGFFVNTLVMRTDLSGDPDLIELVERVRDFALDAYAHQDLPFERLVEVSQPQRSQARHPLFQVMLSLQNTPAAKLDLPKITISQQALPVTTAKFDLSFQLIEQISASGEPQGVTGYLEYSLDLFDRATAGAIAERLQRLLQQAVISPDAPLHQLDILSDAERRILLECNAAPSAPLPVTTLVELFEQQATRTPKAVALTAGQKSLTYAELNEQANRLAHLLIHLGVGPGTLAGIALERSAVMVVAIVAVLKAGGGYLPLNPEYPQARLEHMLNDAAPAVVITDEALRKLLPPSAKIINLDAPEMQDKLRQSLAANPTDAQRSESLLAGHAAYVIYTSGSTGTPKGVVVTHANVTRLFAATEHWFHFNQKDVWTLFHSYAFDFSVWELWGALLYGGKLVVVSRGITRSPQEFLELLVEQQVTVLNQTPSAFYQLMQAEEENPEAGQQLALRTIIFGGEALDLGRLKPWYQRHKEDSPLLVNMYGITETTVHVSYQPLTEEMTHGSGSLIGGNIPDLKIYVLDEHLGLMPVGVAGEMYVSGAGLARGYLNRAGLTAERFVADPYGEAGTRMYRTGDLARRRTDGRLEYMGRADQQVKIRGFRIELGEIEAALLEQAGVTQAAVVVREDGATGRQLVAYVVMNEGSVLDEAQVRHRLSERLPEYMTPAAFVVLDELPLTTNGKLDRRALPAPDVRHDGYRAPRSPQEEILCSIFAQVLSRERVGIHDSFFELGGHSLLAARLTGLVRTALGVELPIRALFESPTVAGLVAYLDRAGEARIPLSRRARPERLPLSYAQQRLWFLYRMEGPSATYNIPLALRLAGKLNVSALQQALADVVARHETLRTIFPEQGGVPYQQILAPAEAQVGLNVEKVSEPELPGHLARAASLGLKLETEIPLRASLFSLNSETHVLLLLLHHIAGDGWSMGPLARDVEEAYRARTQGQTPRFQELPVQYADYTLWQRELLGEEDDAASLMSRQMEFWRKALAGAPEELQLPADRARPLSASYRGAIVPLAFDADLHHGLQRVARECGASLFMVLEAGLAAMFSRLGAGEDIPIGTVVAGRSEQAVEDLVGFFVNTLVMRTDVSGDPDFMNLVKRVREFALEAYAHQDIPFERLVEAVQPVRSMARHPLVQTMLVLQNAPQASLDLAGLKISPQPFAETVAKFDLTFLLSEQISASGDPHGLSGYLEYSLDLFDRATAEAMAERLQRLLQQAVMSPDARLHQLDILSDAERRMLLECNAAVSAPLPVATLVELFEQQAARTPKAVALRAGQKSLTYAELNEQANRLAHLLIHLGVGPGTLAGIALERSAEMVVAIVAVLKAGGGYLPLNPEYPQTRLKHMLNDAAPAVIITDEALRRLMPPRAKIVNLDAPEVQDKLRQSSAANSTDAQRSEALLPGHPAYVIYTSGSTGTPKGVVVTHANVTRLFAATEHWFHFKQGLHFNQQDVWTLFHSYAFDFSVWELWGALLHGGKLVVVPRSITRSPQEFLELLVEQQVTVLNQTPSAFYQLMQAEEENPEMGGRLALRTIIFGGEALDLGRLKPWYQRHKEDSPLLVNMYGITETTVHVSYQALTEAMTHGGGSLIGGNIPDLKIYVLDEHLGLMPVGVAGEMYVSGAGLARGYLNRAGLTAERFVADPYGEAGTRMYRTGDLARRRTDGRLEYMGRADQQVKIRGFRIELGEIEAALLEQAGVRQAAVVVREDGPAGRQLVAYVVMNEGSVLDEAQVRHRLSERLPEYMTPAAFVVLDELPLTTNGKLDRRALPAPDVHSENYVPPRTPQEELLCAAFARVLATDRAGIHDNFFELGGHSLLAVRLVSEVRSLLNVELPIRSIFEAPTVAELAAHLEGAAQARLPLQRLPRPERLPLSYAQQRLWFLHRMEGANATYNIPAPLRLRGEIDAVALEQALGDVVERHESLRTIFPHEEGVPFQHILSIEEARPRLILKDVSEAGLQDQLQSAAATAIDLERQIPLKVWLFRLSANDYVLLFLLHHIASDGWSLKPLGKDLQQAYSARTRGQSPEFAELPVQYADYTLWQRKLLGEERDGQSVIASQMEFWRKALAGAPEELQLPADHARPAVASYRGETLHLRFDADLHRGLQALARDCGATMFMVLQAGLAALLARLNAGADISLGTVVAGREDSALDDLVGFFVNTLVMRTDVSGNPTFAELVKRVRNFTLEAYANQDVPFELLVEALQPGRSMARHPLFQILLNLQNTPKADLNLNWVAAEVQPLPGKLAKYDLSISVAERSGPGGEPLGLEGDVEYSLDLFERHPVENLIERLARLLRAAIAAPYLPLHSLNLLTVAERHTLLEEWNGHSKELAAATFPDLFEAHAVRSPDAPAVISGTQSLTYQELDERSNRLAHYLIQLGAGPESLVGIAVERSLQMVVAIMAAFKAGAAYLPLDPDHPQARIAHMLSDASPAAVLTTSAISSRLRPAENVKVVTLDDTEVEKTIARQSSSAPARHSLPQHPAYVIYTSGSSGTPKGVVVTHAGIPSLVASQFERLKVAESSRVLQFASLNFDASFWEVAMALTSGAALVLAGDERSGAPLRDLLVAQKVTHALLPLGVLATLEEFGDLPVECLINGGEALPAEVMARWSPGRRMINAYGPTETTVCATISAPLSGVGTPTIGSPLINTRVYVLDANLEIVPAGVKGELYVSGPSLARGYLKRPSLTAERFIADPYASGPGARMYRTGDLARRRADGTLEFAGRADEQVKVRGFRIELGEIESALRACPEVAQAVVIVRDDKVIGNQLVAYVVGTTGSTVDATSLRRSLSERLPAYMVPSAFVTLDVLPLTSSGKLDRKALPAPEMNAALAHDFVAPASELEQMIAEVWREVLGREKPGIHENFFDLGGHSLLLARVHAKLQKRLTKPLPMVKLFEHPTIAALANYLELLQKTEADFRPTGSAKVRAARRTHQQSGEIAIIGMACRFPGASSIEAFWDNLKRGVESVSALTGEELAELPKEIVSNPNFVNASGQIKDIDLFDAAFFGLTPAEATATDPQQRLMLECAWEAFESAGYSPQGQVVGVFAGAGESQYRDLLRADQGLINSLGDIQLAIGTGKDHIAPRLSYLLDLRGPSVPVNTACSTSLVAVHMACRSLLNFECDMALAGGVSLGLQSGYVYQESSILSPDGMCRAFDAEARGTVPGSGAGVVLLKRLDEALADGDAIHAVIQGSAVNNDGNAKVGYTAPSVEGQRQVIEQALATAGVSPEQISYIETHGTGTPLGDPIEIEALRQVFSEGGSNNFATATCALGAVKTNIGHLDSAAGVAGLIKTALCLRNRTLVPSLHFNKPNPQLDLERSPFYVNTETTAWPREQRFAGVSSFGIGGTNAHVVLSEPPQVAAPGPSRSWQVLTLSAKSESALLRKRADLVNFIEDSPGLSLADVAFTLNMGRKPLPVRQSVVCSDRNEALAALSDGRQKPVALETGVRHSVVFLFPGQGKAYPELGRHLYHQEPSFRHAADFCCNRLAALIGADLRQLLFIADTLSEQIYRPLFWQPALFVIEYALARLWMSWGIVPAAMVGHSLGEYVAATLAGVLDVEDALALVAERARATERLEPGAMLAMPVAEAEITPYIKDRVSLAAVNAPQLCVLAGPTADIERLQMQLAHLNPIPLQATHAFHSVLVEPVMQPLTRLANTIKLHKPRIPYLSNVTGTWIRDEEATDPEYWARHVRQTVRFSNCMEEIMRTSGRILLEVGPGKVLTDLVRRSFPDAQAVSSFKAGVPDGRAVAEALGQLWMAGATVDWKAYYKDEKRHRVALPAYPFERKSYWVNAKAGHSPYAPISSLPAFEMPNDTSLALEAKAPPEKWLYVSNWKRAPLGRNVASAKQWLVFADHAGFTAHISTLLRNSGQSVIEVRNGDGFEQNADGSFCVARGDLRNYGRLFEVLHSAGQLPDKIIHGWGLADEDPLAAYESLIYLAQTLRIAEGQEQARIAVLNSNIHRVLDEDISNPARAAALGIVHVLPKENPKLACQSIDIGDLNAVADTRLAESVLRELGVEKPEPVVALRLGHRWIPVVDSMLTSTQPLFTFRSGGTYLITHAFQEIGLALAERLVQRHEANVLLMGRTFFPQPRDWEDWIADQGEDDPISRKIARLKHIRGNARVITADLADSERMKKVKTEIEREFGAINGVMHLEKTVKTGLIQGKMAPVSGALQADVAELKMIEALFSKADVLVLFSSNMAESGGLGQVEQAARNAILGCFAEHAHARGSKAVTVEWGTRGWREAEEDNPDNASFIYQQLEEKRQRFGMTQQECLDTLDRALALELPDVIVSTRDFTALMEQQHLFTADFFQQQIEKSASSNGASGGHAHTRPEISTAYEAPRSEVEKLLAEIWKGSFRFEEIGVNDNFFELGGHSLLAVQLIKNMNDTFSSRLALKDLFEAPTIGQLAALISGAPANDAESAELEALLAEIEGMSEDKLRAELDSKS